ncbi:MAG: hypothetical protein AB1634_07740 [Thermodesulfobacteriota bacterium]
MLEELRPNRGPHGVKDEVDALAARELGGWNEVGVPETRTIWFACRLNTTDAMSKPSRMSTPFCRSESVKSSSTRLSQERLLFRRSLSGCGLISQ